MLVEPRLDRNDAYLHARLGGTMSLREALRVLEMVRYATIEFGDTRLLVDMRQMQGSCTEEEQSIIASHGVRSLSHLRKVAWLLRPDQSAGLSEGLAGLVSPGVFVCEQSAVDWLVT